MPFPVIYHPVVHVLALKEYHASYGDAETLQVWVNPPKDVLREHSALVNEFVQREASSRVSLEMAGKSNAQASEAMREMDEFNDWVANTYLPRLDEWYARLWSQGSESYSAEDVRKFGEVDEALANWLRRKSMSMISAHRSGQKKA